MGFETPSSVAPSVGRRETSSSDPVGFGETIAFDGPDAAPMSVERISELTERHVPDAAADPVKRANVRAEIARKEHLLDHIDGYLSKNSSELLRLPTEELPDDAYRNRLETLNEGSKEWVARGGDLEEKISRLKRSIGADDPKISLDADPQSVHVEPSPASGQSRSRLGVFFSGIRNSVNDRWDRLKGALSPGNRPGRDDEMTEFPLTMDFFSDDEPVRKISGLGNRAKVFEEIARKEKLFDHINDYLAKNTEEIVRLSAEANRGEAQELRLGYLNREYAEWMIRAGKLTERIARLQRSVSDDPAPPAPVVAVPSGTLFGRTISHIKKSVTGSWAYLRDSLSRGGRKESSGENNMDEVTVVLDSYEHPFHMGDNPYPITPMTPVVRNEPEVLVATPVMSEPGVIDTPVDDPFVRERYAYGQAPAAVASLAADFERWRSVEGNSKLVAAMSDTEMLRKAYEQVAAEMDRYPALKPTYEAQLEIARSAYVHGLDVARLMLAKEIKDASGGEARKKALVRQFASVMKDLRQFSTKGSSVKTPEEQPAEERKAA